MEPQPVLTVPRADLLRAVGELAALCREYRALHERIWEEDAPGAELRAVLARHRKLAVSDEGPFAALGAVGGLLNYVVERMQGERVVFRLPGRTPRLPAPDGSELADLAGYLQATLPPLDAIAAQVYALAQSMPTAHTARIQRVIYPAAALFKSIVRQDWADADLMLTHLNMVSTHRENHELVEHVGRLVRNIHDSLLEISGSMPLDALSSVSDEIPDAVEKMHTVIAELEVGANRNLDLLEVLSAQVNEGLAHVAPARAALERCDGELDAMAATHPAAAESLQEVRKGLRQSVAAPLEGSTERLQQCQDLYMTLLASQSYQDLTGQTLKKVIAFIESLQYQLIQVISKYSGKAKVVTPADSRDATIEAGPDADNRLSQDHVDSMLADLGF